MSELTNSGGGRKQIAALDGVRGLAIFAVLLIHLQQIGAVPARFHLVNVLMHSGWCGVDLFFVLSGFLITLGLLDSKDSSNYFSAFYMRRVLRIFPLYYAVLIVAMICSAVFASYTPKVTLMSDALNGSLFPTQAGWVAHLLYVQNWWMPWKEPASQNILGHFWSLGIEEQFYLVWPLCVWLLPRKRLLGLCVAVCPGVLALRFFLIGYFNPPPHVIFMNTVTRADTLIMGALCALLVTDGRWLAAVWRWLPIVATLGAGCVVTIAFGVRDASRQLYYTDTLGFTALAMTFGSVVIWAYVLNGRRNWSDRILSVRPLTELGKYSYGLYVYHLPLIVMAKIVCGGSGWFGHEVMPGVIFCVCTVSIAIGVAVTSYELFEKRFLRLKRYFKPRQKAGSEAGAGSAVRVSIASE